MAVAVEARNKWPERERERSGLGTGVFVPAYNVSNEILTSYFLEPNVNIRKPAGDPYTADGVKKITGIGSRHWVNRPGKITEYRADVVPHMAVEAALGAVIDKGWDKIDCLLVTTTFPYGESLGKRVAEDLKFNLRHPITVDRVLPDVYAACSGSAWVLHYLGEHGEEYRGKRILLISSEYISPTLNNQHLTLFSDGAGALAFTYGEDLEVVASKTQLFPETEDYITFDINPDYIPQEGFLFFIPTARPNSRSGLLTEEPGIEMYGGDLIGNKVFETALRDVPLLCVEAVEDSPFKKSDIDWFFPHQANGRISDVWAHEFPRRGFRGARIFSNIEHHGNTSSASIPIALHEAKKRGLIQKGTKAVIAGFGAGMFAAVVVVEFKR